MRLPISAPPVERDAIGIGILHALGLSQSGPCDECTQFCVKNYAKDPARYAACCEGVCGDKSKVCWYACCNSGPRCRVPS